MPKERTPPKSAPARAILRIAPLGLAVAAALAPLLRLAAGRHRRARAHEQVLLETAARLAGAPDRRDVYRAAVEAALRLAGDRPGTGAALFIGSGESLRAVAAAGAGGDDLRDATIDPGVLPDGVRAGFSGGRACRLPGLDTAVRRALPCRTKPGDVIVAPLRVQGEVRGVLTVAGTGALPAGLTRPLDALAKTIALAIETATRNEELRRRQSEEQFRRLADQAQDIIYRYEVRPNPGFTYMSPALTRVVEYTPQDAYADRDFAAKLVHPDDLPTLQAMLKGQLAREPTTFRFFHKRGHLVWVEVLTVPVYSEDGTLLAIEGIARDITARKQMEDQLLRAQRLETAGRIAGQVAHDFNNLLAPLVGYPDLIRAQLPPGHPAAALCADMLEAANHLVAINEELLTLGRRGHFTPEPTDLNRLIDQGLAQLGGRCAGIRVDLRLAPDLLPVRGAPSQLLRVISNLIGNACEAMSEGGTLTVQTENVYLDVPVGRYNRVAIGEYVRLDVADTGVGIAPEVVDRIFDAFFTTKRADNRRGSGLGLSVVQAIVTDHQGYIDVESRLGQGSTFSIYLPVSREPARTEAVQPNLRGGDETILVVDDDAGQRDITRALLLTLGYQVDVVAGGEEAIARLRCHPADLLVLDLIMPPGIDGAETYRRACQVRPGQRAIIVSGHAPSDRVREAQALGAGAYLRKPVTLEKLARAVRAELDRDAGSTG